LRPRRSVCLAHHRFRVATGWGNRSPRLSSRFSGGQLKWQAGPHFVLIHTRTIAVRDYPLRLEPHFREEASGELARIQQDYSCRRIAGDSIQALNQQSSSKPCLVPALEYHSPFEFRSISFSQVKANSTASDYFCAILNDEVYVPQICEIGIKIANVRALRNNRERCCRKSPCRRLDPARHNRELTSSCYFPSSLSPVTSRSPK
jgi:hypothetical protein